MRDLSIKGSALIIYNKQTVTSTLMTLSCPKNTPPSQFGTVHSCIQTCIEDVHLWMNSNKLKFNTNKTEFMPVSSAYHLDSVHITCTKLAETVFLSKHWENASDSQSLS